jgi:quinol monooxygenase YgiN
MSDITTTTMINPITVTGDHGRFREIVDRIASYMSAQDGFVRLRFYQSHKNPDHYYMVAEWVDLDAHQRAADNRSPEVLSWFDELREITQVAPDFFATLDSREAAELTSLDARR